MNYKAFLVACVCLPCAIYSDGFVEQYRSSVPEKILLSTALYSMPNFISVFFVSLPFMFTKYAFKKILLGLILGTIVYEFMQAKLDWGTTDYMDIVFTILAGLISVLVYKSLIYMKVLQSE
tara:strand:+ start:2132 stop:2494 length:363 start_codon:yes stop_codon:yes gene_type:complete